MRRILTLHPESRCRALEDIAVEVLRPVAGTLELRYVATGRIDDLRLPPVDAPMRRDGLWRRTCFEAFLRTPPGTEYCEFNFAPSRHWAAYSFTSCRTGMRVADEFGPPRLDSRATVGTYELGVSMDLDTLASSPVWNLGLAAVIEEKDGTLSYWALAHPPGRPDFHHADCFALDLPVAEQP